MNEAIRQDVKKACEVMQKGGIILYPTDTIWGIGCDATNAEAVKRVFGESRFLCTGCTGSCVGFDRLCYQTADYYL